MSRGDISPAIGPNTSEEALLRMAQNFGPASNLNRAGSALREEAMRSIIAHPNVGHYTLNVLSNFFNVPADFQVELAELVANHPKGENALNQGMTIEHSARENRVAIGMVMVGSPKLSQHTFRKQIVEGFRSSSYSRQPILEFHRNIDLYAEHKAEGEDPKTLLTRAGLVLANATLKSKLMYGEALKIMTCNFGDFPEVLKGIVASPEAGASVLDHLVRTHAGKEDCRGVMEKAFSKADVKGFDFSDEALIKLKAVFPGNPLFRFVGTHHYQL